MVSSLSAWQQLVHDLDLSPHPEGGYYKEVWRANTLIRLQGTERSAGTSIYYLLAQGAFSAWHQIDADEVWYFHAGSGVLLYVLEPDGNLSTYRLGDPSRQTGQVFQAIVRAGCWFAAELVQPDDFSLLGCAVAPGFEFQGFKLARESDLAVAIQKHGPWLRRLLKAA